jgi:hypothetical protein
MNWKGHGRSRLRPNFRHYRIICRETKKNHENNSGSRLLCLSLGFNPGPPEYEREG